MLIIFLLLLIVLINESVMTGVPLVPLIRNGSSVEGNYYLLRYTSIYTVNIYHRLQAKVFVCFSCHGRLCGYCHNGEGPIIKLGR